MAMRYRSLFVMVAVNVGLLALSFVVPGNLMCAGLFSFIGDIAKGVTGIGTAIFGGIKGGKERKKAAKALKEGQAEVNREKAFNDTLFNREYYQDYMQRSENQSALKVLRDRMRRENAETAQTAVVMGATPEAVAKQKEITNSIMGDTVSQIAANSSSFRDNVMNRYLNYRDSLNGQMQNLLGQKSNLHTQNAMQWSNLMQNGLNSLASSFQPDSNGNGGLGNLLGSLFKK